MRLKKMGILPSPEFPAPMHLAVVIVNYRTAELVLSCLHSVAAEREALPDLRVVVVDNLSGDNSVELLSDALRKPPFAGWVDFIALPHNGGFGWGNNQAMQHLLKTSAPPDAILLLNPDARIEPGAILALAEDLQRRPDAGAIGSQLVNEDGSLSGSAFRFPTIGREFMRGCRISAIGGLLGIGPTLVPVGERGPVDWVTGASVLLRTRALREAGLFDTGFFLYFEEVELMHRFAHHGWKCYHCPDSRVIHIAGASTGVVDGQSGLDRPPPDYVFQARRRFFSLTRGRRVAFLANIAWLAGDLLGRLLAFALPGRAMVRPNAERAALLRLGLRAQPRDARPAVARGDEPPGRPPEWMA